MTDYDLRWAELEVRRQSVAAELESLDWRAQRRERERGQIGVFYRGRLQASLRKLHERKTETRRLRQILQQRIDENLAMTPPLRRDRALDDVKKRYGELIDSMKASWLERVNARAIERLGEVERSLQESVAVYEYEQDLATREQQIKERIREQRQRVRSIQEQLSKARNDHDDELFARRLDEQRQEAETRARAVEEAANREHQRQLSRLQLARDNEQRLKDAIALELEKERQLAEVQAQMTRTTTVAQLMESQLGRSRAGDDDDGSGGGNKPEPAPQTDTDSESHRRRLQIVFDPGHAVEQSSGSMEPALGTPSAPSEAAEKERPVQQSEQHQPPEIATIATTMTSRKESQTAPAAPAYQLVPKPKPKQQNRPGMSLIGLMNADPSDDDTSERSRNSVESEPRREQQKTLPEPKAAVRPKLNLSSLIAGDETDSDDVSLEVAPPAPSPKTKLSAPAGSTKPSADEFDF